MPGSSKVFYFDLYLPGITRIGAIPKNYCMIWYLWIQSEVSELANELAWKKRNLSCLNGKSWIFRLIMVEKCYEWMLTLDYQKHLVFIELKTIYNLVLIQQALSQTEEAADGDIVVGSFSQ